MSSTDTERRAAALAAARALTEGTDYAWVEGHRRNDRGRVSRTARLLTDAARTADRLVLLSLVDDDPFFGGYVEHYDADGFKSSAATDGGQSLIVVYTD